MSKYLLYEEEKKVLGVNPLNITNKDIKLINLCCAVKAGYKDLIKIFVKNDKIKAAIILSGATDFREPFPKFVPLLLTYMDERIKNILIEFASSFVTSKKTDERILELEKEHLKKTPYFVCRKALLNTVFEWKKNLELSEIKNPILI